MSGRVDRVSGTKTASSGSILGRVKLTTTQKNGIHSFPAWSSVLKGTAWSLHYVW